MANDYIEIPQELKDTHHKIELCSDIMYIQGQMFLIAISKKIKFITIQAIKDKRIPISNKAFDNTFRVYNQPGLQIQRLHVDTEFKPMEDTFKDIDITINYAISQENVP